MASSALNAPTVGPLRLLVASPDSPSIFAPVGTIQLTGGECVLTIPIKGLGGPAGWGWGAQPLPFLGSNPTGSGWIAGDTPQPNNNGTQFSGSITPDGSMSGQAVYGAATLETWLWKADRGIGAADIAAIPLYIAGQQVGTIAITTSPRDQRQYICVTPTGEDTIQVALVTPLPPGVSGIFSASSNNSYPPATNIVPLRGQTYAGMSGGFLNVSSAAGMLQLPSGSPVAWSAGVTPLLQLPVQNIPFTVKSSSVSGVVGVISVDTDLNLYFTPTGSQTPALAGSLTGGLDLVTGVLAQTALVPGLQVGGVTYTSIGGTLTNSGGSGNFSSVKRQSQDDSWEAGSSS